MEKEKMKPNFFSEIEVVDKEEIISLIFEVLNVEGDIDRSKRAQVKLMKRKNKFFLRVEAKDLVSLQTFTLSFLRYIYTVYSCLEVIEDGLNANS